MAEQIGPAAPDHVQGSTEIGGAADRDGRHPGGCAGDVEVRLGAIYALERIARDSDRDHCTIMEVLCAYARNPQNCGASILPPSPSNSTGYQEWMASLHAPRVDIQAVLTVLARRPRERQESEDMLGYSLDFAKANLQNAVFRKGRFAKANFVGAHLDRAWLRRTDLQNAKFMSAHLVDADLVEANLGGCWFSYATMNRAGIQEVLCVDTKFDNAKRDGAAFSGARLIYSISTAQVFKTLNSTAPC